MNVIATTSYGRFRQILKSTDAGISWGNVFEDSIDYKSPKQTWPRDMSYPTNNFCIVSCDSNYFLKTIDGGKTWKENQIDTLFEDRGLQHVSMFDDKFGIMTSRHYMFISDDGFESWKHLPLPGWYTIISLQMISPDIITFIGVVYDGSPNYDEKFFKSTDRGKTWAEYPYPNYIFPYRIRFLDSLTGFIAGSDQIVGGSKYADLIYKTTDGGESWWNILDTICILPFGLQDMDMFDKENGIAVGQFGKIYWTHNGGNTWERDSNHLIYLEEPPTMRTCMIGKNTALIADYSNRILRSSLIPDGVVEKEAISDEFSISPNPAEDFIEISKPSEGSEPSEGSLNSVRIFNVFGETVFTSVCSADTSAGGGQKIDVSGLPSGVYFVRVGNKVSKFVKI